MVGQAVTSPNHAELWPSFRGAGKGTKTGLGFHGLVAAFIRVEPMAYPKWYDESMNAETAQKPLAKPKKLLLAGLIVLLLLAIFSLWNGLESLRWGWRFDRAKALLAGHDPEGAYPLLDQCALDNSSSAEAAFLAGRAARMTGRLDSAKTWLDQARGRGWTEVAVEIEQALLGLQAGMVVPYQAFAEKCLEVEQPDRPRILEVLTRHHLRRLELPVARRYAEDWTRAEADNPMAWNQLGTLEFRSGDNKKAEEAYRKALALDQSSTAALEGLAVVLRKLRQSEEALLLVRKLEEVAPGRPGLDKLVGACLGDCGQTDQAIVRLRRALADNAADNEAAIELARVLLATGAPGDARKVLQPVMARAPFDREALEAMAGTLERMGDRDEEAKVRARLEGVRRDQKSADAYLAEIGKDPRAIGPRLSLAELLWKNGLKADASRWAESVLEIQPTNEAAKAILQKVRPAR